MKADPPKTQTLAGLIAATEVSSPGCFQVFATAHFTPFQRSAYPLPTAQMFVADEALAAMMKPPSPGGRGAGRQRLPPQCSAAGALVPPGLVPPNTQASFFPGATTAE